MVGSSVSTASSAERTGSAMLCELYAGMSMARFCVFWPDNVLVEGQHRIFRRVRQARYVAGWGVLPAQLTPMIMSVWVDFH